MGSILPQLGSEMSETPTLRSSWSCLVDLYSQAPRSKHLSTFSNCISCTDAQLPGKHPDGSPRLFLPFPRIGIDSKDHLGGCSEKLRKKLHPPHASSPGGLKSFPEPYTQSVPREASFLECISTCKVRATCKNPAVRKNSLDCKHGPRFKCRKTLDDVKMGWVQAPVISAGSLDTTLQPETSWPH